VAVARNVLSILNGGVKMSADNYIGIWKCKDGKYRGYDLSASCDAPKRKPLKWACFVEDTLENAIKNAQAQYTEYGFRFMNDFRKNKKEKNK
jgi:ribosomal protein L22